MLTEATAGLIGALGSAGLGLISQHMTNKANEQRQNEANQLSRENLQWQKEQYFDQKNYNEALQNKLFEREDNSYQRTKDDLLKAGYSPLAINGTNDAGTVVSNPSVPELPNINPFQATSLNFGQFADILGQAQNRRIQERALDIQESKNTSDKEQKENELKEKKREFDDTINEQKYQFDTQMAQRIQEFSESDSKKARELELKQKQIDALLDAQKLANSKYKAELIQNTVKALTGVDNYPIKYIKDASDEEILELQDQWSKNFANTFLRDKHLSKSVTPKQSSETFQIGIAGTGGSKTESKTWDFEGLDKYEFLQYANLNPYPMPVSARP